MEWGWVAMADDVMIRPLPLRNVAKLKIAWMELGWVAVVGLYGMVGLCGMVGLGRMVGFEMAVIIC